MFIYISSDEVAFDKEDVEYMTRKVDSNRKSLLDQATEDGFRQGIQQVTEECINNLMHNFKISREEAVRLLISKTPRSG